MLDVALAFLVKNVNSYLELRTGTTFGAMVVTRPVDEAGKWAIPADQLGASIINIEEERVLRSHLPETLMINGHHVTLQPELKLNLHVLFAANFQQYDQALKQIALVLTYFQSHLAFTPAEYPGLDPRIEKLTMELQSLSYEQLNQVWAFVGGKQLPSVIYKVRMIAVQDRQPAGVAPRTTELDVHVRLR